MESTLIDIALETIDKEIAGLTQLKKHLGSTFLQVVELLQSTKGKVVFCGLGKSGHIAKKLAATLASTGRPSFFVHACEAVHGDLGMISEEDVVILISNSGSSAELVKVAEYAKKIGVSSVAITANPTSDLGQSCTLVLTIPKSPEADILNKVPTTSAVAILALGDALAMVLMHLCGFGSTDFEKRHPGGAIGSSLQKVKNIMHVPPHIPMVQISTTMQQAIIEISEKRFGCTAVVDEKGTMVGVITDGDVRRAMDSNFLTKPVSSVMSANFITISPEDLASEAMELMASKKITSLFILGKDSQPIGLVHIHDLSKMGLCSSQEDLIN